MPIAKSVVSSVSWRSPPAKGGTKAGMSLHEGTCIWPEFSWKWKKPCDYVLLFQREFWIILFPFLNTSFAFICSPHKRECTDGFTQKLTDMCSLFFFSTDNLDPHLLRCYHHINTSIFLPLPAGISGEVRWGQRVCQGCCSDVLVQSWHTQYFHVFHKATKYLWFGRKEKLPKGMVNKHWQTLVFQKQRVIQPWITTAQTTR